MPFSGIPSPVPVKQGGSGLATLTAYALMAAGTTSTSNMQQVSGLGTAGQMLTSNGAGVLPTWQGLVSGATPITGAASTSSVLYNASGTLQTSTGLTYDGTTLIATGGQSGSIAIGGTVSSTNAVVVGQSSTAGDRCVSLGSNITNSGAPAGIAIGRSASVSGVPGAIAIGWGASNTHSYSVAIGADSGTPSANSVIFGSALAGEDLSHIYFGNGGSATPTSVDLNGSSGAGSNIVGGDFNILPGNGTGTGGSGSFIVQTAPAAGSSSTANTYATRLTIDKTGASIFAGSFAVPLVTKTGNYTLTSLDCVALADGTSSTVTITLPTAVGCTGRHYIIKAINVINAVTVATTGGQTIDGAATYALTTQYQSITVVSNNANWWIV